MNTLTPVKRRHSQTAEEYQSWLKANITASAKRRHQMFDIIADNVYQSAKDRKEKPRPKKVINRV